LESLALAFPERNNKAQPAANKSSPSGFFLTALISQSADPKLGVFE
jgi:hypothetical protein